MTKITIYYTQISSLEKDGIHISFEELKSWVRTGKILKQLFRYSNATLIVPDLKMASKPFATSLILWALARGKATRKDLKGHEERISVPRISLLLCRLVYHFFKKNETLKSIEKDLTELEEVDVEKKKNLNLKNTPIYLRTDSVFGLQSGGSVGHIAGVLNNLNHFGNEPIFISSDLIPTVSDSIRTHVIDPDNSFWDFNELPALHYNTRFFSEALKLITPIKPSFIYQRYSINNYCGLKLSKFFSLPFVLEFNGSEVWVSKNWGTRLQYEKLAEKIERVNLEKADLIIVVSKPLKDELVALGLPSEKILINPNGVNVEKYHPDIDGTPIREKYNLSSSIVIGFIGTFGSWHGAEVLAQAFGNLMQQYPEYQDKIRLLMIGNGQRLPVVKEVLEKCKISKASILTGPIPQQDGPKYLAACDILVSPQVPNKDGSPFFGSPTKMFEYMAMGKGIVASNLDQIGEVLEHNKSALLTKPGDAESLMRNLHELCTNKQLRERLGTAARCRAVERHSWKEHTRKIIEKLASLC